MKRRMIYAGCAAVLIGLAVQVAITAARQPVLSPGWAQPHFERAKMRFVESAGRIWFHCEDFVASVGYKVHRFMPAAPSAANWKGTEEPAGGIDQQARPPAHLAEDDV